MFTNWINYHVPNCIQYNLIDELRDGTKLLSLLEALTGESLVIITFLSHETNLIVLFDFYFFANMLKPGERGKRLRRPHFLSNANNVLQFLEKKRVS